MKMHMEIYNDNARCPHCGGFVYRNYIESKDKSLKVVGDKVFCITCAWERSE